MDPYLGHSPAGAAETQVWQFVKRVEKFEPNLQPELHFVLHPSQSINSGET